MKYKLKRNLPFAKAGTEIGLTPKGCIPISIHNFTDLPKCDVSPIDICEEYINELISEGWIEEVKPREFELHINNNSHCLSACYKVGYGWLSKATHFNISGDEIIKVREVLND